MIDETWFRRSWRLDWFGLTFGNAVTAAWEIVACSASPTCCTTVFASQSIGVILGKDPTSARATSSCSTLCKARYLREASHEGLSASLAAALFYVWKVPDD